MGAPLPRQAPGAPPESTSSGLAIANVLGTGVELNGDGLDPAHGLVAVAAATATTTSSFKFKNKNFKLDVTSSLNL